MPQMESDMSYSKQKVMSLGDALKKSEVGEVVNSHVLEHAPEPKPDFEQMQRTVRTFDGTAKSQDRGEARKPISEKA